MRLIERIAATLIGRALAREPDQVIGGQADPYLRRWWLLPRNPVRNVYLHQFLRSDDDRALHDHPWLFNASWLLQGSYVEHTIAPGGVHVRTRREAGALKLRFGPAPHRVELEHQRIDVPRLGICGHFERSCWTVFITGPRVRTWGFHCPEHGWVHWRRFTDPDDPGRTGPGCEG
jgi:hypothetical protein